MIGADMGDTATATPLIVTAVSSVADVCGVDVAGFAMRNVNRCVNDVGMAPVCRVTHTNTMAVRPAGSILLSLSAAVPPGRNSAASSASRSSRNSTRPSAAREPSITSTASIVVSRGRRLETCSS